MDELGIDYKKTIDKEEINNFPVCIFEGDVVVIDRTEDVDAAVAYLKQHRFVGFDTETKPAFKKGEFHPVSLLQLGVSERVYLFRLNKCGLTKSLRNLLASNEITKIGVGILDDIRFLRKLVDFKPAAFLDLQVYVTKFGIEERSFSKLMAIIFNVKISKRQRTSNWETPELSEAQIRYAATDAWGAFQMYRELSSLQREEETNCGSVK